MNFAIATTISRIPFMTGEELKQFRERVGLSQRQLAEQLKVAPNTISRWEIGERKIPEFLDLALATVERNLFGKLSIEK